MDASKRRFLRGGRITKELRPPWLLAPTTFTDACTRCGKCINLCAEHILVVGDAGFPLVEFGLGECTFCGDCGSECEADLFHTDRSSASEAWRHKAVVSDACLAARGVMCRSCEDACEPQAIRFPLVAGKVPGPVIDAKACTGCGACLRHCPEQAIALL